MREGEIFDKMEHMERHLQLNEVESLLEPLKQSSQKEECWSCDCLQAYLVQMELDCDDDISALISQYKVPTDKMHGCLGCAPCPPAEVYSEYLKKQNGSL